MSESKDDSVVSFALFALLAFGVIAIIWYAFRPQLAQGMFTLRQAQIYVASVWADDDAMIEVDVKDRETLEQMRGVVTRHRGLRDPRSFDSWRDLLQSGNYNPQNVQIKDIAYLSHVTLDHYRTVFAALILIMGIIILYFGPTSLFRRHFGLLKLMEEQAKMFPFTKPFIKFDPNKLPVRAPGDPVPAKLFPFAEALGPEEWIAYHKIPVPDNKIDAEMASEAFATQLGPRWRGPKSLKPYQQIMLAAFCLKASRKREEADELLGKLSACWDHKTGLKLSRSSGILRQAQGILRKKELSEKTLKVMKQHAFVTTALLRGLDFARSEGGVLAPATFLWLRGHERELWYPLNNLGKNTYHMESLGAMSHYRAEKRTQRPIPYPKVDDAVESLTAYMEDPLLARPIPQLDYSVLSAKEKAEFDQKNKKSAGIMKPVGSA